MSSLPSLSRLNLEQRNALEARLLAKAPTVSANRAAGPQPLTPAQESLWIAEQLTPGLPLYNIPLAFRITGPLQPALVQRSWQAIVRRHEALRTRLSLAGQTPMQQAAEDEGPRLELEDLGARSLHAVLQEEARAPFKLTEDALVRSRLIRLGENEHVWTLTLHHLIADHQSLGILLRELSEDYKTLARGGTLDAKPEPAPFLEIAAAQSREGAAPETTPGAGPRSGPSRSGRGDWRPVSIPAEVVAGLREFAQGERATLFMALAAIFGALHCRLNGRESVTIGAPVSQRDYPGAEETVGLLINTAPLAVSLAGDPSFKELLGRVRTEAIDCLRRARALPAAPAFEAVFQLVDELSGGLQFPGATVAEIPLRTGTAKFDLTISLAPEGSALRGNAEYSQDAFDAATVDRWMERYVTLLRGALQEPEKPLSEIPLLSDAERRLVVEEWNRTETNYPRTATIAQLFAEQAKLRPDATALRFEGKLMTYAELDARASQVAAALRQEGVAAGDAVAICLPRSPELIAGILGILKAGAAYVPLDVDYPVERRDYMVQDSGASCLISTAGIARLGASRKLGDDAAYVMYTSGSTGQPKGVIVPQRAVVRLVKETNYASFGPDEVFLQFAPVTFDAATLEIWGPLLNGGVLCLFPPYFDSLSQFGAVLRDNGVTTLWLTAGLFHQMVEHNLEALRGVRQLLAGGDVLSPSRVKEARRALPDCRIINGYGPTENTTFSCCHTIPPDWDGETVPIGKPISNTRAYIVDAKFNAVGIGTPGELCVAGDGLALGYLNSPELTAQKFVRDPFSNDPSARLYRTGDLARYRTDGTIEFLGRIDQQVKIRGFRVELGEVEEALRRHPHVSQAAVVARQDATQTRQLVAFLVPRPGQSVDPADVRRFLREREPAHLIPSRFFVMASLPLTPNGKVDRRQLPTDEAGAAETLVLPRTDPERALAQIWEKLLGVKQVGVDQNFFELGGHSLLAMRLQSQVFQTLGAALSLREIFEHPTIAALAQRLAKPAAAPALIPRRRDRAKAL
ncbi:MAG TPA: amino acid adenylation domain-containing protein [Verrucomicrobiae bacterium]|jgi:aspartate racemase|nr:amino acid adenylation domain-containing protein [Verrucomicrobiae bacterium]